MQLIACVDQNWGIGRNGNLLFRLPADMKFFRATTIHQTVVMGGNTFRSLPGSKPLPNRDNVVLSTTLPPGDNYLVVRTLNDLLAVLRRISDQDSIFIAGGEQIYRALLPYCDRAVITKVGANGNADRFFPNLDQHPEWSLSGDVTHQHDSGYNLTFCHYIYKGGKENETIS
ncbi:MAG: dihydrofolate reductase [Candidatus Nomurabacteria bacterium]|jgi:dihydrofolate reductase|nr:dihydrofolate reductase [Candidatus Nomurabacteria bacterium]